MSKYEQEILSTVNLHGRISVMELARILQVSDQTVRRIVKPMVAKGSLSKVHGALVSTQNVLDPPFLARMTKNRAAKVAIADAVAGRIPDGSAIAIDTGSTSGFIAQALRARKKPHGGDKFGLHRCHVIDGRGQQGLHGGNTVA